MPKTSHPLYSTWHSMHARCTNPNATGYCNYGARGITVCERWSDFDLFVQDMGEKPEGFTLDRIENNSHYCPKNCKWSPLNDQLTNRRFPKLPSSPNACIRRQGLQFIVTTHIAKGNKVQQAFYSLEEAKEFRDLLFYEREFTRQLSTFT